MIKDHFGVSKMFEVDAQLVFKETKDQIKIKIEYKR